jgi:hypothetical protein
LTVSTAERRKKEEGKRERADGDKKYWQDVLTGRVELPMLKIPAQSDAVTKIFERLERAKAK